MGDDVTPSDRLPGLLVAFTRDELDLRRDRRGVHRHRHAVADGQADSVLLLPNHLRLEGVLQHTLQLRDNVELGLVDAAVRERILDAVVVVVDDLSLIIIEGAQLRHLVVVDEVVIVLAAILGVGNVDEVVVVVVVVVFLLLLVLVDDAELRAGEALRQRSLEASGLQTALGLGVEL